MRQKDFPHWGRIREVGLGDISTHQDYPDGVLRRAQAFRVTRKWHFAFRQVAAVPEFGVDLDQARVEAGQVVLPCGGGDDIKVPLDRDGNFDLAAFGGENLPPGVARKAKPFTEERLWHMGVVLAARELQLDLAKAEVDLKPTGNDLTDRGATPLEPDTFLASQYWNVANSIITGRFIRRVPLAVELALIALLGIAAALATWKSRVLVALGRVALLAVAYVVLDFVLFVQARYWLPLVLPVTGALLTHGGLVTWRVVFGQAERRRVKSIFSRIVSPKIVNELLAAETLSLGGARREITVFFADVRGFTELTDTSQERVAEFVRNLTGEAAEACFDEQAKETLRTVNLYLGLVADTVIKQDGTWDKFIGDCVMAFWGAPTPNLKHAVACVRATIRIWPLRAWNCPRTTSKDSAPL